MIAKNYNRGKKKAFINNCAPDHVQLMNVETCEGKTESFRGRVQ